MLYFLLPFLKTNACALHFLGTENYIESLTFKWQEVLVSVVQTVREQWMSSVYDLKLCSLT